jgi:hypothetical protein
MVAGVGFYPLSAGIRQSVVRFFPAYIEILRNEWGKYAGNPAQAII